MTYIDTVDICIFHEVGAMLPVGFPENVFAAIASGMRASAGRLQARGE